jgi:hypothetical protein
VPNLDGCNHSVAHVQGTWYCDWDEIIIIDDDNICAQYRWRESIMQGSSAEHKCISILWHKFKPSGELPGRRVAELPSLSAPKSAGAKKPRPDQSGSNSKRFPSVSTSLILPIFHLHGVGPHLRKHLCTRILLSFQRRSHHYITMKPADNSCTNLGS